MSTQYIAWINEQEFGPVDFEVLQTDFDSGRITGQTQVRRSDSDGWRELSYVLMERAQEADFRKKLRERPAFERAPKKIGAQEPLCKKLREETAYHNLRTGITVIWFFSLLAAIVFLVLLFASDNHWGAAMGVAASLGSVLSMHLLIVFLDIADAVVKRTE